MNLEYSPLLAISFPTLACVLGTPFSFGLTTNRFAFDVPGLSNVVVVHDRVEVWAVCDGKGVDVPDPEAEGVGENILAAVAAKILPKLA